MRTPDTFAVRLLRLMNEQEINMATLCDRTETQEGSVWRYLNTTVKPGYANLMKLADFFDVSLDYLCGRTEVRKIQK